MGHKTGWQAVVPAGGNEEWGNRLGKQRLEGDGGFVSSVR